MYQWCGFKSRRGKNRKLTALKSNSNTVWFNFQTYIYIIQYYRDCGSYQDVLDSLMVSAVIETTWLRILIVCVTSGYCSLYISWISSDEASKKGIWTSSEEEAIKHDTFNMALHIAEFFMLDDKWSFRWFIGKFSYVRSFERHDCNYVLYFGIDVSVKTRITEKIGWKKSPCSWHFLFMLS